jgi:hypothetical protein
MTGDEIVAFDPSRRRNARAIVDAVALGWLRPSDLVLDLTHEKGRFWRSWQPDPCVGGRLVRSDIDSSGELWTGGHLDMVADALYLPDVWRRRADVTVWDPPYKENGAGGSCAEDDGYGVADGWVPRRGLLAAGVVSAVSWTRSGGVVLVKCQDQTAGRFHPHAVFATVAAELAGAVPIGVLHVAGTTRPQPDDGREQRSPRNRTSALAAFRVSGRRRVDVDPWAVARAVERDGLRGLLGSLPRRWEPPSLFASEGEWNADG